MKIKLIEVDGGFGNFSKNLKNARIENNLTRKQLGYGINRTSQQIQRYETSNKDKDKQYPTLEIFKQLCLILQMSADELLGFQWVEDSGIKNGVVYKWEMKGDKIYWNCPKCNRKNITHIGNGTSKENLEFVCEYDDCGNFFNKLNDE